MDTLNPISEPPATWLASMARADADVAIGRFVDGSAIHANLAASIARMEQTEEVMSAAPE